MIPVSHYLLPPASRVEFLVHAPPRTVKRAQLITLGIDTGPFGDNDPRRPLATIQLKEEEELASAALPVTSAPLAPANTAASYRRFAGLAGAPVAVRRTVYFDEIQPSAFFMAVEGKGEHVFNPDLPPDIIATQGTVEEWTVQNRTQENHEFHFHQVHFLVESQNNFEINGSQQSPAVTGQYADVIQVPYWDNNPDHPYPSVTLRIDFRGPDVGDFVFHCHILGHEDLGMMNIIRVRPAGLEGAAAGSATKESTPRSGSDVALNLHPAHGKPPARAANLK